MRRPFALFPIIALAPFLNACGAEGGGDAAAAPATIEERGRAAFAQCAVCHSVKDPEGAGYQPLIGPSLFGVYGAKSGHQADYDYSRAMREAGLTWDDATLDAFIANPHSVVPNTRMAFAGEADAEKRAALIAYLKTLR